MSVLYPEQASEWWVEAPEPWGCLSCGADVAPPLVFWRAADTSLLFHSSCASRFGMHLIADAREAMLAGDPEQRVLVFDRHEWECFLDGARNGEFDDAAAGP